MLGTAELLRNLYGSSGAALMPSGSSYSPSSVNNNLALLNLVGNQLLFELTKPEVIVGFPDLLGPSTETFEASVTAALARYFPLLTGTPRRNMRRVIRSSCTTSTVVNYENEHRQCNETALVSHASCLIPDTTFSRPYVAIRGKMGQYSSSLADDQGVTFYKDLTGANINGNLPGRRMTTKGGNSELKFLPTIRRHTNRIQLAVLSGVRQAVITCQNNTAPLIARYRDFGEGEIVDIPWWCSFHSPTVKIWHISTNHMTSDPTDGTPSLMTFEDGSTIADTPATYVPSEGIGSVCSERRDESKTSVAFASIMGAVLTITALGAAATLLYMS
jgi:hypothetical protein